MLAVSALGSIDTPPPSTSATACTAQIGQAAGHAPTGTSAWQGAGGNGGPQPARPTVVPGPQPRNRAGSGPSHPPAGCRGDQRPNGTEHPGQAPRPPGPGQLA